MELTTQLLSEYLSGKRKSAVYEKTSKLYLSLRTHANGEYPHRLIEERRPHESDYVHAYRKRIYEPITKETVSQVIQSLGKIRRSSDWSIKYDATAIPPVIRTGETPEDYCERNFPYYNSITNWTFSVLLKTYLVDPNALILVTPLYNTTNAQEYLKPYPFLFNSDQVLEYLEGRFAIVCARDKYRYYDGKTEGEGDKWYVVTSTDIITYAVINKDHDIAEIDRYTHNLGYLPVIKLRAVFLESDGEHSICESRIAAMLPRLDEAVREYSDQQAAVVNHLFPERWEIAAQPCDACMNDKGISTGFVQVEVGKAKRMKHIACTKCSGTGVTTATGPYKKFVVRSAQQNLGEQPVPIPPFGYVTRDTNVIEVVDKRIELHQYKALCAVNMQFLMQAPLNQSGIAKEVDRDELNNFVYGVAEDLVNTMDQLYRIIIDYRYSLIVPNGLQRGRLLPQIAVPEKFDILSSTYLVDEIAKVKDARLSAIITTAYEIDFTNKKFNTSPEVRDELRAVFLLDPLPGATDEEKNLRKQAGGITSIDYIISCNIVQFIRRAVYENQKEFYGWDFKRQRALLEVYAGEVVRGA